MAESGLASGTTLPRAIVYPWDSMSSVVDGWIARAKYLTLNGSTVSEWAGTKGVLSLVATHPAEQPTWEASGFNGHGSVLGDGLANVLRCDVLSSFATGNDSPWSAVLSVQVITMQASRRFFAFGNSAHDDHSFHDLSLHAFGMYRTTRMDSAYLSSELDTTTICDTSRHVLSIVYSGTATSKWVDGVATSVVAASQDTAAITLDRFALLGSCRTANGLPINARARAFVFANAALSTSDRQAIENTLLAEI